MRTEVRPSIPGVGPQSNARDFIGAQKLIMFGNSPYEWFILRQKERGIDYVTMMRELEQRQSRMRHHEAERRVRPNIGEAVPTTRYIDGRSYIPDINDLSKFAAWGR
jgi:hypothetical protein